MYIKEVVLDGFKSYGTRTVVGRFDPKFNAITGLNGSGKSNILDGICFVLGINNLNQVRANNLQELVYKHGQAGVTKASVTLLLNNEDKANSPVGYEKYDEIHVTRQVVIGGRNKYLINGVSAQQSRVQNLFHSVQLNVNNPHFLIMQGRITKVLNMKPEEILAMMEEAAGTRMYEMKKSNAEKTIAKKQTRVEEIDKILEEEITPLTKELGKQRDQYMQWAGNNQEVERLTRFCVAAEFTTAEEHLARSADDMTALENEHSAMLQQQEELDAKVTEADSRTQTLKEEKSQQVTGEVKETEQEAVALSKNLVKKSSELNNSKDTLAAEEKAKKTLMATVSAAQKSIEVKSQEHADGLAGLAKHEEAFRAAAQDVTDTEQKYAAMSAGASTTSQGSGKSLAEELADCKRSLSEAETGIKQAELKSKHLSQNKKEVTAQLSKVKKDTGNEEKQLAEGKKQLAKLAEKLASMPGAVDGRAGEDKFSCERKVSKLFEQVEMLEARLSGLEFPFSDPEAGFDRSRVKGRVAKLTRVKDASTTTAVEVSAGGRLFQVVVDSDETGKKLLQKGKLKNRVTLIPLNKIDDRTMSKDRLSAAQDAAGGPDLCRLAMDLVDYDEEVMPAMKYVFGNSVVCPDSETARRATFDPKARVKSVTLDGDIFDPSGTLTGGSRHNASDSVLSRIMELADARQTLASAQNELQDANMAVQRMAEKKKVSQEHELKLQQVQLLEQQVAASAYGKLAEQLESITSDMEAQKVAVEEASTAIATAKKRIKELEAEMKDATGHRDKAMKAMVKDLAKKKAERERLKEVLREEGQAVEVLALEIAEIQREVVSVEQQIEEARESIKEAEEVVKKLAAEHAEANAEYDEAQQKLDAMRERIASCDEAIANALKEKNALVREAADLSVERKKVEHKIQRFEKDKDQAQQKVEKLLQEHEWIATEKKFFGRPHTDYDFSTRDAKDCRTRLATLCDDQAKLSKNINKKVMGMYEKAEQEYQELINKKTIIENDKKKIEDVIAELDQKKSEALQKTWAKVNGDFGSIFSTLLPGTKAKLEPPEGQTVLDGLEVKVAFRGVWKQSLQELSGGQRSLLALSLVLAMLRFKPAPMYILDEVDAALDMSHTQNIGQMLKKHFSQSQFIVVSLKDGMFNNANVLFKTKFVDGLSTVMRTTHAGA
jgi:structural maintenance of chromosome 2